MVRRSRLAAESAYDPFPRAALVHSIDEVKYARSRTLVLNPLPRMSWQGPSCGSCRDCGIIAIQVAWGGPSGGRVELGLCFAA